MVTLVVQQRKLIGGVYRHFPHPFCHFGAKAVLQANGLLGLVSVFGRFWGYQILPNFTNFYQKCVAKGVRTGSKRQLTGGFSRPIYLNRVKSGGSCQAISSQLSVISHQSSVVTSVLVDPRPATRELEMGMEGCRAAFSGFFECDRKSTRPSC